MKKKYQVFVSSTFIDLQEERQAAVEAILKAGHIPAGMELFKSGQSQLKTIYKWIDESDIYLLILGGRYGSMDEETGKSYTHLEYEYALNKNMPVFAIIIEEETTNSKINKGKKPEEVLEMKNQNKYKDFKDIVKSNLVSFAKDYNEIKLAIHENIHQFNEDFNIKGWVNDIEDYEEIKKDNLKFNKEINLLTKELEKYKSVKNTYKSGLTFEELKDLLLKTPIEVPAKETKSSDLKTNLLEVLMVSKDALSSGLKDGTIPGNYTYSVVAPKLIPSGLVEKLKLSGESLATVRLTEDGKKFVTRIDYEHKNKIKK